MKRTARECAFRKNTGECDEHRGLECFVDLNRYTTKKIAIRCVIMAAQEWKLNPENLATIARRLSEGSTNAARLVGLQDSVMACVGFDFDSS